MKQKSKNIEFSYLTVDDYQELRAVMVDSYPSMPASIWKEDHIKTLLEKFSEGQIVVKVNGDIAGCALSIIVDYNKFEEKHTYKDITGNYTFDTHDPEGDILYGIDVFVKPEYRGLRLGRRLYEYRKTLCEKLNLKGIIFGGRIPLYHKYAGEISPKEYIEKVKSREIHDPVLNFQLSNDFHPSRVLKGYLEGDIASNEFAVLLKWENIFYEMENRKPKTIKKVVRLGLVQWQMRSYKNIEELMQQAEYFIDTLSGYCNFLNGCLFL